MMTKKTVLAICAVAVIGVGILIGTLFSTKITADIPSASSYAPTSKDWSVEFSQPMNPGTFTKDTVTVLDGEKEAVSVRFEWNDDNTVLTLKSPDNGYKLHGTYQINISEEVKTAQGKNLANSFTHSFQAVEDLPNIKDKAQLAALLNERLEQTVQMERAEGSSASGAEESASSDSAANSPPTSETNVQVEGIDEGDTLKSDGDYIYFARESDIVIASADGNNSNAISTIKEKEFRVQEIFLHNDLLVSIGYSQKPIREQAETDGQADSAIYPTHSMKTSVYIYDISDKAKPQRLREVTMESSFVASRKMDGFLYLVGNHHPPVHILREKEEKMESAQLRPFVKDTVISEDGKPVDFENSYFFPESKDVRFMLLGSIDLNNMEEEAKVETYLGASNQIYMSKDHLYTTVAKYNISKESSTESSESMMAPPVDTEVFQFKIDKGKIAYNTSTVVNGTLINQFAMDERNDTFRVATTKGDMWQTDQPSTNSLYVFDINLNPLGEVEGLAEGERIYSVRFMENTAYMVTFKQVDPLFVIDLKEPENPEVLGKLKIPGFSNYLHPLDDNHVIGFGQHTELEEVKGSEEPRVRQAGLKISVFDVSDPANPTEKFTEILGQGGSHSEINHNHKSLYQHPEKNLFGFPASLFETKTVQKGDATYQEHAFVYEGAFLYNISPDQGIVLKDTITHQKENIDRPVWESQTQRMVSVGGLLYTLSFNQMKVYNLNEEQVITTVEFPKMELPH